MALKRRGVEVVGFDRSSRTARVAGRRGLVSRMAPSIPASLAGSGTVFICVPIQEMERVLREISLVPDSGAIFTDVCSVKQAVIGMVRRILPIPSRFVGGHPMAGSERSGPESASPSLFLGRVCVLTPVSGTDHRSVVRVSALWRKAGATVVRMTPRRHDNAVAKVSHLPHALAAALMLSSRDDRQALRLASGGFLDGTRVSLGDARLWEGIFLANRSEAVSALARFRGELDLLRRVISSGKPGQLKRLLVRARDARLALRRTGE